MKVESGLGLKNQKKKEKKKKLNQKWRVSKESKPHLQRQPFPASEISLTVIYVPKAMEPQALNLFSKLFSLVQL